MGDPLRLEELRALKTKARSTTLHALQTLGGTAERGVIVTRALKIGRWTQRELAEPGTGRHQRRVEYELSWALTDLKRAGLLANPSRGVWAVAGAAADVFQPPAPPVAAPAAEASFPPPFVASVRSEPPPAAPAPPARRSSFFKRLLPG